MGDVQSSTGQYGGAWTALRIVEEPNGAHHRHNKAAAQQDGIYRLILLNEIKETLKQHNVNPSQSHWCGIEAEAPHTTEPHVDLF